MNRGKKNERNRVGRRQQPKYTVHIDEFTKRLGSGHQLDRKLRTSASSWRRERSASYSGHLLSLSLLATHSSATLMVEEWDFAGQRRRTKYAVMAEQHCHYCCRVLLTIETGKNCPRSRSDRQHYHAHTRWTPPLLLASSAPHWTPRRASSQLMRSQWKHITTAINQHS